MTMQFSGQFGLIVNQFLNDMNNLEKIQEEKKKWVLDEWQKTFDMPRKMKKQRRKELRVDWALANYKPFGGLFE